MLKEPIVVGKAYVNEDACVIREVIEEVDDRRVRFNSFELESGKFMPTRHRVCERREIARWADRGAAEREAELIHPYEPAAWFNALFPRDEQGIRLEAARTALEVAPAPFLSPQLK